MKNINTYNPTPEKFFGESKLAEQLNNTQLKQARKVIDFVHLSAKNIHSKFNSKEELDEYKVNLIKNYPSTVSIQGYQEIVKKDGKVHAEHLKELKQKEYRKVCNAIIEILYSNSDESNRSSSKLSEIRTEIPQIKAEPITTIPFGAISYYTSDMLKKDPDLHTSIIIAMEKELCKRVKHFSDTLKLHVVTEPELHIGYNHLTGKLSGWDITTKLPDLQNSTNTNYNDEKIIEFMFSTNKFYEDIISECKHLFSNIN